MELYTPRRRPVTIPREISVRVIGASNFLCNRSVIARSSHRTKESICSNSRSVQASNASCKASLDERPSKETNDWRTLVSTSGFIQGKLSNERALMGMT